MKNIYNILKKLSIKYEKHEHPAVFTVEEAEKYYINIKGSHNKSLFLRNKNGERYFLVITIGAKRLNLKELASFLNEQKLSFGSPEKLKEYLDLTPGSVSPFGLINDVNKKVEVIVDQEMMEFDKQGYHPNINTATLVISTSDFKKFLDWTKNKIIYKKL